MFAPKIAKPQEKAGEGSTNTLAQHCTMSVAHPDGYDPVLNEPGHPLDTAALSDFQTKFGHDFSSVRVHTDEQAAASAASRSARAYTIGSHVVFGRGEYAPGTLTGRHLLGHELAHVVQQRRGGPSASGGQNATLEAAADHAANQASRGATVMVAGSSAVGIACKTIFEEFAGGKYSWSVLKDVLEHIWPIDTIIADVKGLTAPDREQALTDLFPDRVELACKLAYETGQQAAATDPKDKADWDPILAEDKRVLGRFDAVINALAKAGTVRTQIPGWNFTPDDYAQLKGAKKDLTMAPDSSWFPAKLQENLLKTLAFVLGPTVPVLSSALFTPAVNFCKTTKISPPATEGVNALDFFHGHLVIKKDPATTKEAKAAEKTAKKFQEDVSKARTKAIGNTSYVKGYRMDDKKIAAYTEALEKLAPALTSPMETISKIPGAAVMYHTYEFMSPYDLMVKRQKRKPEDPRRHYVTPLDTNTPRQYTPPAKATYEKEFTHIAQFVFLVDTQGAVHVRPLEMSTGLTSLELSTITGTTFPEPFEFPE